MSFRHIFAIHTDRRMSPSQHKRIVALLLKEGIKLTDLAPRANSNINQPSVVDVQSNRSRHINHLDRVCICPPHHRVPYCKAAHFEMSV